MAILPFRCNATSISEHASATMSRTLLATLTCWPQYYNTINEAQNDDSNLVCPPYPKWVYHSPAVALHRNHQKLLNNCLIHKGRIINPHVRVALKNIDTPSNVQKRISYWSRSINPPYSAEIFLSKRWKKLFPPSILRSHT